jgi:hypothetical protein
MSKNSIIKFIFLIYNLKLYFFAMKYLKRFESWNDIDRENRNLAKRIANELGEEIDKCLGSGGYGVAYSTKSNKVIKLTSDESEFLLAQR